MRRVQVLLTEDRYQRLRQLAQERGCSVSRLVREAVTARYPAPTPRERRIAAAKRMLEMNLPVSDWPQMEKEIIRGFLLDEEHLPPSLRLGPGHKSEQNEG